MHIGQTEEWEKKLQRHQLGSPFRKVEYPEQKSLNRHKRSSDRYQTVILLSLEIKAGSEVLWLPLLHWQHEEYRTLDTCAQGDCGSAEGRAAASLQRAEQLSGSKATPQMADLSQLLQPGHRTTEVLLQYSKYQQALAMPSLCIF